MTESNESSWFGRFLIWRVKYVKEKNFILVLSLLVGIVSGLAAILLKNMVHSTHVFLPNAFRSTAGVCCFYLSFHRDMSYFSFCALFCAGGHQPRGDQGVVCHF